MALESALRNCRGGATASVSAIDLAQGKFRGSLNRLRLAVAEAGPDLAPHEQRRHGQPPGQLNLQPPVQTLRGMQSESASVKPGERSSEIRCACVRPVERSDARQGSAI